MKKLGILLMMLVTISASAQKVTRKDLNDLLLKGDTSALLDDGFKFLAVDEGYTVYQRYDRSEILMFDEKTVTYFAQQISHNYIGNTWKTPKSDLFWGVSYKKYESYYTKDSDGDIEDQWVEYTFSKTVMECRMEEVDGESFVEVLVYRK
jgi:hypothetical protein